MCRIAAYLGPAISLQGFLLDPEHSLYRQSWEARELTGATVNADGFGIGWYAGNRPEIYRQPLPIWSDPNLPALARSLASSVWLGNVRSASDGLGIQPHNTQPFAHGDWIFTHNGRLDDFARRWRLHFRRAFNEDIEGAIHGTTDSEYLFGLIRMLREGQGGIASAMQLALRQLHAWHAEAETAALLNFVMTDGASLFAVRHALSADCPSLYYCTKHPRYPDAVLIASEPFDATGEWRQVSPHQMLNLEPGKPASITAL